MLAASSLLVVFLVVIGIWQRKNLSVLKSTNEPAANPPSSAPVSSSATTDIKITAPLQELKVQPNSQSPEGTTLNSYLVTASLAGYDP